MPIRKEHPAILSRHIAALVCQLAQDKETNRQPHVYKSSARHQVTIALKKPNRPHLAASKENQEK